jgi:CheY-like chemotaxis protein
VHILLVDDEKVVTQPLSRFLRKLGHIVECAYDGRDALQAIDSQKVDLLVSDIRMPRMDGIQLKRACRERKPDLPVILMAGYIDEEVRKEAFQDGLCRLVEKPIDLGALLVIIKEIEQ